MIKWHKLIKTKPDSLFVWYLIHNLNLAFSFDYLILKRDMFIEINKHHLYYLFFVFKWGKWPVLLIFIQWTCILIQEWVTRWLKEQISGCWRLVQVICDTHVVPIVFFFDRFEHDLPLVVREVNLGIVLGRGPRDSVLCPLNLHVRVRRFYSTFYLQVSTTIELHFFDWTIWI